jgi:hypothetical protein
VEPEVTAICERAARRFEELGCTVEEATPGFANPSGDQTFMVLPASADASWLRELPDEQRAQLGPPVLSGRSCPLWVMTAVVPWLNHVCFAPLSRPSAASYLRSATCQLQTFDVQRRLYGYRKIESPEGLLSGLLGSH